MFFIVYDHNVCMYQESSYFCNYFASVIFHQELLSIFTFRFLAKINWRFLRKTKIRWQRNEIRSTAITISVVTMTFSTCATALTQDYFVLGAVGSWKRIEINISFYDIL